MCKQELREQMLMDRLVNTEKASTLRQCKRFNSLNLMK